MEVDWNIAILLIAGYNLVYYAVMELFQKLSKCRNNVFLTERNISLLRNSKGKLLAIATIARVHRGLIHFKSIIH